MSLTNEELEYWTERFLNSFPATYPPDIWVEKEFEHKTGIWPFLKTTTYTRGVCKLCGELLITGHRCDFIREYIEREKEDNNEPG